MWIFFLFVDIYVFSLLLDEQYSFLYIFKSEITSPFQSLRSFTFDATNNKPADRNVIVLDSSSIIQIYDMPFTTISFEM